ncbi:hypothetical protein R1sor_006169 [Riccia sorocarpa]|uniref:Endonuclease/exonuclease/phosphatase domain-containing protein n=1 Tax=Riccia sorocarpa TaxID=122646 RepID=A0ABD3HMA5_9MARC
MSTTVASYQVFAASSLGRMRGVAILCREDVKVTEWRADGEGRWVWVKVKFKDEEFQVASVYAPNDANERSNLWEYMTMVLPGGRWLVAGDWNSVVNSADSNSRSNRQSEDEALHFRNFCVMFDLKDAKEVAARTEGPRYTRAQMRDGKFCWSRLDRLYTSDYTIWKVVHHPQFCSSDHLPLSATMDLELGPDSTEEITRSAYFKVDKTVVQENFQVLKDTWQKAQEENCNRRPGERFLKGWVALRRHIKSLQYEKAARLKELPEKEWQLQILMEREPSTLSGEEEKLLGELLSEIRALQAWKQQKWRQTCRDMFLRDGDACTAFFFQKFKKRKARTTMRRLQAEGGQIITSKEEIKAEVYNHYSSLYSAGGRDHRSATTTEELLGNVQMRLSPHENTLLDDTPTELEIFDTLRLLPSGKSPGPDGFSTEVFAVLWPLVGGVFCEAVIEFWESGVLLPYFKDGLLFLLPKVDDPLTISQWRPITLLNSIYKVIAKLIAARMAVTLPGLIPVQQQGFLRGWSTHNCILTFALVHESLKRERRVPYSRVAYVSCTCLANDFAVYTPVHEGSVRNLFYLLDRLEEAAGCKVNKIKSKLLVLGAARKIPSWVQQTVLHLLGRNQSMRYQGASLTTLWRGVDNGQELLSRVTKKAVSYSHPLLSFESRIIALKHAVFSPLVYHLLSARFKLGTLKKADSVLRDYVWSKNDTWKKKKALASWELVSSPQKWGGLGIPQIRDFQSALIVRIFLRAFKDPNQSLWLPIFSSVFLKCSVSSIMEGLWFTELPSGQCSVASLLLDSWVRFTSLYRWSPLGSAVGPDNDVKRGCFLLARKFVEVHEAGRVAERIVSWAAAANVTSLSQLQSFLPADYSPLILEDIELNERMILELRGMIVSTNLPAFSDAEWAATDGKALNLGSRAAQVYTSFVAPGELTQMERFNRKWGVDWGLTQWRRVWSTLN